MKIVVEHTVTQELSERQARSVVRQWIEVWLAKAQTDGRYGVAAVSMSARHLRQCLDEFEKANSGDHGK